jgi:lysozyme
MGKPGVNDRNIYDDAVFLVSKDTFIAFNCNVDPSAFKAGVATVLPGWYPFKKGNHGISRPGGGYPAFRPATPGEALPVKRDGESTVPSKHPGVATNIHKGGLRTTSSLGCLTIHPKDWATFHAAVVREMDRNKLKTIPVGIIDGPIA